MKIAMPTSVMPVILLLIAVGSFVAGYWWWSSLTTQAAQLDEQILALEKRKAQLDAVIKQDQIYEARKKTLESRVKIIEGLQKNQLSPVLALDQLAEAVERTQFVWLSSLDQKDAILTLHAQGTTLSPIADLYTKLHATRSRGGVTSAALSAPPGSTASLT